MTKLRVAIFIISLIVVGTIGTAVFYYARGYRLDGETGSIEPRGLLVANSDPNGAQVIIDGELETATNATVSLAPGTYKVVIKKEGFIPWEKQLTIAKEEVTQIDVTLFTSAPSLTALGFSGAVNPVPNEDFSKVAYAVPPGEDNLEKEGLWVIEATNLPIGFSREPRRITNGDLTQASWEWSFDSRQILLTTELGAYLLDAGVFTPSYERVNVTLTVDEIKQEWEEEKQLKLESKLAGLVDEIEKILAENATDIAFSPDDKRILYTASSSATIPEGVVVQLPGSSTQKQIRDIKPDKKYVYDVGEDRNFEIAEANQITHWFPTSAHLVLPNENSISIIDYDGTNKKDIYTGAYTYPYAFPYSSTSKLLILTNFGAQEDFGELYSLNLR